jgi:LmbE family N-acetylglucosaminyl deacetylase
MTTSERVPIAAWDAVRSSAAPWNPPAMRTTVVVPHPDDEVVMFGGLIQHQIERGVDVHVIAVTDGATSGRPAGHGVFGRRADIRRDEQHRALGVLGVGQTSVTRLELPHGDVAGHEDAVFDAIVDTGAPIVVAPWFHDHHGDHEACGRATRHAAVSAGAATYFGLFGAWTHTEPDVIAHQRLIRLPLGVDAQRRRHTAMVEHRRRSTDEEIPRSLDDELLAPLGWSHEYYLVNTEPLSHLRLHRADPTLVHDGHGHPS